MSQLNKKAENGCQIMEETNKDKHTQMGVSFYIAMYIKRFVWVCGTYLANGFKNWVADFDMM